MKATLFALLCGSLALAAGTEPRVKLPTSRADLVQGQKLFQVHCARCHGAQGEGNQGPALNHAKLARAADDAALLKILEEGIRGTEMPGADAMNEREQRLTAAYVRSLGRVPARPVPGDSAHGAEIYSGKGSCAGCHSIHGEGGVAGPDLSTIGTSRSAAHLRESVLEPDKAVPEGFLLVKVTLKAGSSVSGIRVNEDSFSIQVRDSAGRSQSFWKTDVANIERQRGKSPMPSYKERLSEAEVTDVVAYLASLKEKP